MIITKILGGLGNQLFQYAAGKALAEQNKSELKLDLTGFANYTLRDFELSRFNTSYKIASAEEIEKYKATTSLQRLKSRITPAPKKHFYKQPFFRFDPAFFALRPPVYIQGYFQSEKFFAPVGDVLRKDFQFKENFSAEVMALAEKLQKQNSVSIHVRRGDYKNPEALKTHGILPPLYYQKAIEYLKQISAEGLRFYLFSDDATATESLRLADAEIVSGVTSKTHYDDFFLMSQCRHNVIANSSFSWWAAWLNKNPQKTVIAPQQWFGATGPKDTGYLLPETWVRL